MSDSTQGPEGFQQGRIKSRPEVSITISPVVDITVVGGACNNSIDIFSRLSVKKYRMRWITFNTMTPKEKPPPTVGYKK
jgi:hypothetical protein